MEAIKSAISLKKMVSMLLSLFNRQNKRLSIADILFLTPFLSLLFVLTEA
jgi:hypothetical protein